MFGLTKDEYEFLMSTVVHPQERTGAKIFCFGSRARGTHHPFSDIDIMVESDKSLSDVIRRINELVIESNFPYKVDIVEFSNFAESYKAGYLQDKKAF